MKDLTKRLIELKTVDVLKSGNNEENFVGRPFSLSYQDAEILICDDDKERVKGIPQGCFLLAYYDNDHTVEEAILLRALAPAKLPTDSIMIGTMIEYYKDNLSTSGKDSKLDSFTKYEFSFSGLKCSVLGTFYRSGNYVEYGADVENFFAPNNYKVYKVVGDVLEVIVNQRDSQDIIPGGEGEAQLGKVRYSSSKRNHDDTLPPVYVNGGDFLGKRTALFGMTRTGKSNTVKKLVEVTSKLSSKALREVDENALPINKQGIPSLPVGQIIFDINGEYANANQQDGGSGINDLLGNDVVRYSTQEAEGFEVLKINFYKYPQEGLELIRAYLDADGGDYVKNFLNVSLERPESGDSTRCWRRIAAFKCILFSAGFPFSKDYKVKFKGIKEVDEKLGIDTEKRITLQEATSWFSKVWDDYEKIDYIKNYPQGHEGREWADEDLKALLVFLTRKRKPGGSQSVSGFIKLRNIISQHTTSDGERFTTAIENHVRNGKTVIIDLSKGNPEIQRMYSERLCRHLFYKSMERFTDNKPNNFIQFYFEEAHNLFPKKEDKDLSQIYNRIAKEGAKLNLGLIYATQEVSSISTNILKNTQNWFIAHLNNDDEIKELRKYYDFGDFADSLIRFSAKNDKGFVRMKTYSNPFIVPVQIDRFEVKKENKTS